MTTKLSKLLWQWRGVAIAAPTMAGLAIALRMLGMLQMLEWAALDRLFCLRSAEPVDDRIAIVEITEADVRKTKRWPMSDAQLTELLEKIKAQQPTVIGLDLYRDLEVNPGYQDLVKLFTATPNLVGIRKVAGKTETDAVAPPPSLKYPERVGANDLILDADGKIRRFFLSLNTPEGNDLDGFGVKLALQYLGTKGINPEVLDAQQKHYKLGKAVLIPMSANEGGYIRADVTGSYQLLLNYRGRRGSFRHVSMTDVLENRIPPNLMRDRIVLVGASALSLNDLFQTPHSSAIVATPERMPGVEIHANITSQLLSSALDGRPRLQTWSEPLEWLWILAWSVIGTTLTWVGRNRGSSGRRRSLLATLTIFLSGGVLIGCSYLAFVSGWWIPVVPPLLALTGSALIITAYIAKSAGDIRQTFGRYLTDDVVANLLENPEGLKLGGERRKITILTSDLRGFTAISERLQPEEVVRILNLYLGRMADVITAHQGTIDEFMGDGILVLFGAPTARENDAQRSVACAVAMQLAMSSVNEEVKKLGLSPLKMGIGINTGEVVVGNIGSAKRTKYGVVGSQVNLTYRIESYTTEGQILISGSTLKAAGDFVTIFGEKQVQPKGVKEAITIYDVCGIGGKYNVFLPKEEQIFFSLAHEIPLQYAILDGKHISETMLKGSLVKLSAKIGEVKLVDSIGALSNIKLNFLSSDNPSQVSEDVYAKVLEKQADNGNYYISFTNLPPKVEAILEQLYKLSASRH